MGGKIRRPHSQKMTKTMKKEVIKGEKHDEIEMKDISKEELEEQKKLFSKMPIKEKPKPSGIFPEEKKHKKHPHKKAKRTTPGEVELGKGPNIPHLSGDRPVHKSESKILEKNKRTNKKLKHIPKGKKNKL